MALDDEDWRHIQDRLSGLCREVGTLLVAFAPLDFELQEGTVRTIAMVGFVLAGGGLFLLSLVIDLRSRT
jgi:hypothetical protein